MHGRLALILATLLAWLLSLPAHASLPFSPAEQHWIDSHRQQPLMLGVNAISGMELFTFQGQRAGYVPELVDLLNRETGLQIRIEQSHAWSTLYNRFLSGELDLILGANATPQRRQFMAFTRPVISYPYRLFVRKGSQILTLGDLHDRRVGFISDDVVFSLFPARYPNIHYHSRSYVDMRDALAALAAGEIEGLIMPAGNESRIFLQQYPSLQAIASLQDISSDMTLATRLTEEPFASLIDKLLVARQGEIRQMIERNRLLYNRQVLALSPSERHWLDTRPLVRVGMADDYLPFDAVHDGQAAGITGAFINELHQLTGLRIEVVSAPFNELRRMLSRGQIDMLNMANTPENRQQFLFSAPFFRERDIIIGRRESPYVQDVYGLEGKRVAVIDGFWHENYLRRNLQQVDIHTTRNLQESLQLLSQGEVDYLLENPSVLEYYISGLGYRDLERKGNTSADSFMYFAVNPAHPELVTLFDKALTMMDAEQLRATGLNSVPDLRQERMRLLVMISTALAIALVICLVVALRLLQRFVRQRAANRLLQERQQLMLLDPLTGAHNRLGFNQLQGELAPCPTPQAWWVIDLNNLKSLNDHYGHLAGDALLVQFAQLLRQQLPGAHLFRMGGDEFVVVQTAIDQPTAIRTHQQLLHALEHSRLPIYADKPEIASGWLAAAGMVWRPDSHHALHDVIRQADLQMYAHKRHSKQRGADNAALPRQWQ